VEVAEAGPVGERGRLDPAGDAPGPAYSLSLSQSEALALQYSYAVRSAMVGREIADGRIMSAWSNALPKVTASASKTFQDTYATNSAAVAAGKIDDRFYKRYQGQLQVSQPLYSGGKTFAALRAARLYNKTVGESIRLARQGVLYNVRVLYYRILLSQEMVRVSEDQVELAKAYLEDVRKRKELETATAYDVLRAEVELTNEETVLTSFANQLDNNTSLFLKLLGLPLTSEVRLLDRLVFEMRPEPKEQALYVKALALRPELRTQELQVEMQRENISATRADLLPQLSLSGVYSGWTDSLERELDDYDKSWQVGLQIDWMLFDGLLIRGRVREMRATLKQMELDYKDLADEVRLEVRSAILDIESARQQVLGQQKNVEQARESLRLTRERERQGVSTHLDVLSARQTLAVAERNYYESIFNYNLAWASLKLALGSIEATAAVPAADAEADGVETDPAMETAEVE